MTTTEWHCRHLVAVSDPLFGICVHIFVARIASATEWPPGPVSGTVNMGDTQEHRMRAQFAIFVMVPTESPIDAAAKAPSNVAAVMKDVDVARCVRTIVVDNRDPLAQECWFSTRGTVSEAFPGRLAPALFAFADGQLRDDARSSSVARGVIGGLPAIYALSDKVSGAAALPRLVALDVVGGTAADMVVSVKCVGVPVALSDLVSSAAATTRVRDGITMAASEHFQPAARGPPEPIASVTRAEGNPAAWRGRRSELVVQDADGHAFADVPSKPSDVPSKSSSDSAVEAHLRRLQRSSSESPRRRRAPSPDGRVAALLPAGPAANVSHPRHQSSPSSKKPVARSQSTTVTSPRPQTPRRNVSSQSLHHQPPATSAMRLATPAARIDASRRVARPAVASRLFDATTATKAHASVAAEQRLRLTTKAALVMKPAPDALPTTHSGGYNHHSGASPSIVDRRGISPRSVQPVLPAEVQAVVPVRGAVVYRRPATAADLHFDPRAGPQVAPIPGTSTAAAPGWTSDYL